jgi:hypothetical protein
MSVSISPLSSDFNVMTSLLPAGGYKPHNSSRTEAYEWMPPHDTIGSSSCGRSLLLYMEVSKTRICCCCAAQTIVIAVSTCSMAMLLGNAFMGSLG